MHYETRRPNDCEVCAPHRCDGSWAAATRHFAAQRRAMEASRTAAVPCVDCGGSVTPGKVHFCSPPVSPADREAARVAAGAEAERLAGVLKSAGYRVEKLEES